MGSDDHYPEERPARRERIEDFWIDRSPVTNAAFSAFVEQTGYVTLAERVPAAEEIPGAAPEKLVPGSIVFSMPPGPVDLRAPVWWSYVPGADWRHPTGPESSLADRSNHPVVHVGYEDALTFARWAGKRLPSEAEWERAARGGLEAKIYAWGDDYAPGGRRMANTWQGTFPYFYREGGGWGTTAIGSFPPNGLGLLDMIGNVWEWTSSFADTDRASDRACCAGSLDRGSRIAKGGSYLCAPNYCTRYRPAARMAMPADTTIGHLGFRCASDGPSSARLP